MTKAEKKVLKFIKKFIEDNKYSPSMAEIAKYMGFTTRVGALYHCQKLKEDGYIDYIKGVGRTMRVLETGNIDEIECKAKPMGPVPKAKHEKITLIKEINKEVDENPYA